MSKCEYVYVKSTRTDSNGNKVEHGFNAHPDRGRGWYDCGKGLPGEGWKRYDTDQDAWYYGVWVNFETRQSFSYCEGDTALTTCPDEDHFRLELKQLEDFHGPPPGHIRSIDCATGEYKQHPLKRPTIEEPNPPGHGDLLRELLG